MQGGEGDREVDGEELVGVGKGRGHVRPTRSQPVTGHHIRRRAGMRTFLTPRLAREKGGRAEKQSAMRLEPHQCVEISRT